MELLYVPSQFFPTSQGFHPRRTLSGDRHHRDARRPAPAGGAGGPRSRAAFVVHQQLQAVGTGDAAASRRHGLPALRLQPHQPAGQRGARNRGSVGPTNLHRFALAIHRADGSGEPVEPSRRFLYHDHALRLRREVQQRPLLHASFALLLPQRPSRGDIGRLLQGQLRAQLGHRVFLAGRCDHTPRSPLRNAPRRLRNQHTQAVPHPVQGCHRWPLVDAPDDGNEIPPRQLCLRRPRIACPRLLLLRHDEDHAQLECRRLLEDGLVHVGS